MYELSSTVTLFIGVGGRY